MKAVLSNWFVGHFHRANIGDIRARKPILMINVGCYDPAVNPLREGILVQPVKNAIRRGKWYWRLLKPTLAGGKVRLRPRNREGAGWLTRVTGNGRPPSLPKLQFWAWDNVNVFNDSFLTLDEIVGGFLLKEANLAILA